VASSKSGSMLNFHDFTSPLSQHKSLVQAMLEWFEVQAPFELWEQEWYYGMILNGDPTLQLLTCVDTDGDGLGNPGYPFNTCAVDNCPDFYNPDQADSDGDGVGDACCCILRGDIDNNGGRNISDLTYYVDYLFGGGTIPPCPAHGDFDGDSTMDITDLIFFVDYLFGGGSEPPGC